MKLPSLGTGYWVLTTARIAGVVGCGLAIAIALPWWVIVSFGALTLWAFATEPPPRRLYICYRGENAPREAGRSQLKMMTDREAVQRNAALAANGLEERWLNA